MRALRYAIRIAAFAAAVCFAVLWLAEPRAEWWAFPLSAYALSGSKRVWQAAIALTGLTAFLVAALPFEGAGLFKRAALSATAAGLMGVALIPTDPWFPWEHPPTLPGAFHVLATGVAMGSFALFAIAVIRTERGWVARILPVSYVTGLAITGSVVIILVAAGRSPRFIGLAEWILLALALACCAAATAVWRLSLPAPATPASD